jgi:hypothetical protein
MPDCSPLRRTALVLVALALTVLGDAPPSAAATVAPPPTLRVDYVHSGNAREEHFALERVVLEPLPWPGDPEQTIDDSNLGKYLFEVIDRATRRVLYSRGFSSIFGEWETTGEAAEVNGAFGESLRFPAPAAPVQLVVSKRDAANDFREVWSTVIDPADMLVDRSPPPGAGELLALQRSGEPEDVVDLLILGDGYTAAERGKCEGDAKRLMGMLFAVEPFAARRADFNVWGLCPAAAESGIARPSTGIHRRSPVGTTYDAFRSERYVLTFDNRAFRDVASQAPYEFVEIMTNSGTYGGGGIFGQFATVAADSEWAPYLFVHELAHHFAALADEYYTSDVAYEPAANRIEPWEPNVTALLDPARLKWRHLVAPGTPLPTPWGKEAFEARSREIQAERRRIRAERRPESEMDALFRRQREEEEARFAAEPHAHAVGAFEGANYEAKGYFRPQVDCIMFTRDRVPFCEVCRRAIERVIDLYAKGGTRR